MPKYNCKAGVNHLETKYTMMCDLCEFTTRSETAVKLHMKFSHKKTASEATNYSCGECDENFDTHKKSLTHSKSHKVRVKSAKHRT